MTSKIRLCPYRCGDMLGECSRDEHGKLVCGAVGGRPPFVKSVLLYAPSREHLQDLIDAFRRVSGCTVSGEGDRVSARYRDMILRFTFEEASCTDLQRLHDSYFNMVVVDLRPLCGRDELGEEYLRRAGCLLEAMDGVEDIETRYGFHRLMALVSARDDDRADRTIAELASKGLGRVVRDRSGCGGEAGVDEGKRGAFGRLVLDEMVALMLRRKVGRQALCASGGGITGLYFEMGVLKCLDDCLDKGVHEAFDLYYGISAGAILTGMLANGYTIDECMAAFVGHEGGRVPPLDLTLFRTAHLDLAGVRTRMRDALRYLRGQVSGRRAGKLSAQTLVLQSGDLVGPPLQGAEFQRILHKLFSRPGTTDDFRRLRRPLYVGATDQDRRTHVLFGDAGHDEVPISLAIQASFSLNPAFASTRIGERYYEDGAVTQTSNFGDAIRKGADLIFVIDPLVPYVSKHPGFAHRRGMLYNVDQNIRTLSYTRFEQYRNATLRRHEQVSTYTFLPANRLRGLMSVNALDHRPFAALWRGAYLSTLQRIQVLQYRMCGDVALHGNVLDTRKAEQVAARLRGTERPSFEDFFPDGRVAMRVPR